MSGVPKRYSIVTKTLKKLIDSNRLGEILSLDFVYYRPHYEGFMSSWRNTPEGKGGVIFDAGYQIIDVLLSLVEEPVGPITCQANNKGFKVETIAKIGLKFKNSSTIASVNLGLHPPNGVIFESIVVQGSKGTVVFKRIKQGAIEVKREFYLINESKIQKLNSTEKMDIDFQPLSHFVSMIQSGKPDLDLLAKDLRTIEFIERVYNHLRKSNERN